MTVAVVTLVHGRHDHLALQRTGLAAQSRPVDLHVVVTMDDDVDTGGSPVPTLVVEGPGRTADGLPLAAARNAGAAAAAARGADVLVLLDVDCVPGPGTVARYAEVGAGEDALWCGTVAYLPPAPPSGYRLGALAALADPHPARPAPPAAETRPGDHRLFWSLSFAVTTRTWDRVGGFDESYTGYGGEDTDFAERARHAGVPLHWVGGAPAYHQHHPTSSPPTQHLHDVVRNARLFHARWGWWPMEGWLEAFADLGLAERAPDGWRVLP